MKFILPRLFGLAIIAGIAALLLSMIFKLLISAAIIGTIVHLVGRKIGRRNGRAQQGFGPQYSGRFDKVQNEAYPEFGTPAMRMNNMQRNAAIIPIN